MKSYCFWAKVIGLSVLIIVALAYLLFVGGMEYLTAFPGYLGGRYWVGLFLHIAIMIICVLYGVDRIRLWVNYNK